ncbi:MAG: 7-cyano-7-deazaguanine synthase QueC [Pseudomonadales bacterium]
MNPGAKSGASVERAVVLVSGGLDSATVLALARARGFDCFAISFAYGQRSHAELDAAARVARAQGALAHQVVPIDLSAFGGSALTDSAIAVPDAPAAAFDDSAPGEIPVTYVPARNTVFLSLALAWAEVLNARHLFIGANAVDYSGYPDCRPEFLQAFEDMANLATRIGVEEGGIRVHAPLVDWSKARIITEGVALGVDFGSTVSCYQADSAGRACGRCDSCALRARGFADAGVADPTPYQPGAR